MAIAATHQKSTAEIALRWVIQQGVVAVTASNKESHDLSNLDIFSFALTNAEMMRLSSLTFPPADAPSVLVQVFKDKLVEKEISTMTILSVALMAVFAGIGVAFVMLHFCQSMSIAGAEPLLGVQVTSGFRKDRRFIAR
eukprot:gnl/MRDRNA2_/MRDRNA2_208463_c0_seq1.p2 gnl/MRDRNA2_/MRDRNA2_208463_c0~~gnl/MRDRNA2_/MRDRNA2_208463_c0_seq1.p2  ORF type:complete len:147 (-),score=16.61 gnl/MRDRNA2_/MRDRNA2_208463_c0_seq1:82-498(-)